MAFCSTFLIDNTPLVTPFVPPSPNAYLPFSKAPPFAYNRKKLHVATVIRSALIKCGAAFTLNSTVRIMRGLMDQAMILCQIALALDQWVLKTPRHHCITRTVLNKAYLHLCLLALIMSKRSVSFSNKCSKYESLNLI